MRFYSFGMVVMQATERFEAIYPTLKEVALAGSPGSKAMKQVSQQIFSFAIKAAGESIHTRCRLSLSYLLHFSLFFFSLTWKTIF